MLLGLGYNLVALVDNHLFAVAVGLGELGVPLVLEGELA
jgi:hypothetical protein